ncbi:MAG TPA: amidohydrolase family protein [Steroidobacteraceae bacterium]
MLSPKPAFAARDLAEPILEPDLPIVDAHHHLWLLTEDALAAIETSDTAIARGLAPTSRRYARYLLDELLSDVNTGHNIRATVYIDAHAMYRTSGPDSLRSVGEVEFANGVAAMSASGAFGDIKACAGIVGNVDLRIGDAAEEVLNAHLRSGGARYRGVRCGALTAYDADTAIFGPGIPHLLQDPDFRLGFRWLQRLGLSYDVFVLEPQLPDVMDLARAFSDTPIILNHVGVPLGVGQYAGKRQERFPIWRRNIRALSTCENVVVKLGGLGLPLANFRSVASGTLSTSEVLAKEWKSYIDSCIDAFGVHRCMFESNFPVDAGAYSYPVVWNVFKRLTVGASKDEKAALFSGTATKVYRLDV